MDQNWMLTWEGSFHHKCITHTCTNSSRITGTSSWDISSVFGRKTKYPEKDLTRQRRERMCKLHVDLVQAGNNFFLQVVRKQLQSGLCSFYPIKQHCAGFRDTDLHLFKLCYYTTSSSSLLPHSICPPAPSP